MIILKNFSEFTAYRSKNPEPIAFVPTMGNLHRGHLKLVETAKTFSPHVLVSIFVNPTQFNDPSDFEKYPRTQDDDLAKLSTAGVTAVYLPNQAEIYSDNYRFQLSEKEFSQELCGAHRPGHFEGVLTIVLKLLNISQAKWLILGLKDFQQYQLLKDMAQALFLPVEVFGVETVREDSGLAMSSRNNRLSAAQLAIAPRLFATLSNGNLSNEECRQELESCGFKVDYVESKKGRRLAAAFLGEVRLIDNVSLDALNFAREEPSYDLNS